MDGAIIQQGRFTSDGTNVTLNIRSDVDFMYVYNETVMYAAGAGTGAQFYWQRGMTQGRGVVYLKTAATNALQVGQLAANAGFFLRNSQVDQALGPAILLTAGAGATSNATRPVVLTGDTSSLAVGDVVRLIGVTLANSLNAVDFTIDTIVANTSFRIANPFRSAIVAGTATANSFYRKVNMAPWYSPATRSIANISVAANAVVTVTANHNYRIGQQVRMHVPAIYGMTQMDGLQGTIIAVDDPTAVSNPTFTLDIDSTAFTPFTFPVGPNTPPFTLAEVVPFGENTGEALVQNENILADAVYNIGYLGMTLIAGAASPAGVNNNVIYWAAGKSFNVDNR